MTSMSELDRRPPADVRRALRKEVGFGCPMPGCGNPYLEYHHFDPPWAQEHHHNPGRMVALCATHHAKAGALTIEQCRKLKQSASERAESITGRFDWMRRDLVTVAGSVYYYETPVVLAARGQPLIWFTRDTDGYMLLSLDTPDAHGNQRVSLSENDWTIHGDLQDVESPPNGSTLKIYYKDGDRLVIRFREWTSDDADKLRRWHPALLAEVSESGLPVTTVSIYLRLKGLGIDIDSTTSRFFGATMSNCVIRNCATGIAVG
jgi:hypothetical protein